MLFKSTVSEILLCQVTFTIRVGVMLVWQLWIQSYALSYALNNLHIALGGYQAGEETGLCAVSQSEVKNGFWLVCTSRFSFSTFIVY